MVKLLGQNTDFFFAWGQKDQQTEGSTEGRKEGIRQDGRTDERWVE